MKKKTTANNKINIGKAILKATSQLNPDGPPDPRELARNIASWTHVNRDKIEDYFNNEYEEISALPLDEIIQATNNYIMYYRNELIRFIINQRYHTYDDIHKYKRPTTYQTQIITDAEDEINSGIQNAGGFIEYLQSIRAKLKNPAPDIEVDLIIKLIDRITELKQIPESASDTEIEKISGEMCTLLDLDKDFAEIETILLRYEDTRYIFINQNKIIVRGKSIEQCAERSINFVYSLKKDIRNYSPIIRRLFLYRVNDDPAGEFTAKQLNTAKNRIQKKLLRKSDVLQD